MPVIHKYFYCMTSIYIKCPIQRIVVILDFIITITNPPLSGYFLILLFFSFFCQIKT